MAKAILVMDMPKDCFACDLESYGECKAMFGKVIHDRTEIAEWCPLKPIPEKRDMRFLDDASEYYRQGWNACIDAICGKE